MAGESRPGGLTALAVINFVFGGLSFLGAISTAMLFPMLPRLAEQAESQGMPPDQLAGLQAVSEMGAGPVIGSAILSLATAVLMLASAVGYLKLKRRLGRTVGNVYAVVAIASSVGSVLWYPRALGGGFSIMLMLGLVYPILTLVLLNTTFRDDFVN